MATLAGSDLKPLPYESTHSLLLRLGYMNSMGPSDFRATGIYVAENRATPVVLSPSGRARLRELTNWRIDPREEWLYRQLQHAHILLPQFRFCAKCLTHGYHSYFFQLATVETCPVHGEKLWSTCPCCDAKLGPCHLTPKLFAKPYHCINCHRPLGLGVPTPSAYSALERQRTNVSGAFSAHWMWVKRVIAKRRILPELFQLDFGRPLRPQLAASQASVLCAIEPSPFMQATMPLTVLSWHLRSDGHAVAGEGGERARLTYVYRATLRLLQRWILSACRHSNAAAARGTCWTGAGRLGHGDLDCGQFSQEECAYMLLRYAVERDYQDRSIHSDVTSAMPWSGFYLAEHSLQDYPRLPLRAIFLAMYAEGYLRLQGRNTFSPSLEGVRNDAELVLCTGHAGLVRWGFVSFPHVSGMPTLPFHRVDATVDSALFQLTIPPRLIPTRNGTRREERLDQESTVVLGAGAVSGHKQHEL
ncbi:TniQ family protein [Cupriavidus neocaledonicus]|uniref:TniQ domain-containing protein n=1 Tax=Cupriavidus neocaledonicus TaxID=1040979 RepID=A0A375H8U1_9BURK|nr:TniQ family protein [Cupriavidus neocaledonicus]SPD46669.1 protein of unknown function [Cupriavidus neocaledonicus]